MKRSRSHADLKADPEAKRVARAMAEEPWLAPFLTDADPMIRRLGSMMALQELRIRLGEEVRYGKPARRPGRPRKVAA